MTKWLHLCFPPLLQSLHNLFELFFFPFGLSDNGLLLLTERHDHHCQKEAEKAESAGEDDEHEDGQVGLTWWS